MEAGAEDLADEDDHWVVTCAPADLAAVRTRPRGGRAAARRRRS